MTNINPAGEAVSLELAALAEAINQEQGLTASGNATEDARDKVHLALKEKISEILPQGVPASTTDDTTQVPVAMPVKTMQKGQVGSKSYLDNIDDATVAKVNGYIAKVFQNGIKATLREVIEQDPFVLDVFHDALTDKLYGEMKARGLVK